ncbi:type II secretion system F family protein [Anderseniella sp. Alg231-50]|uniref:type II secretion system F family protein n=1 Tax=Anderseniella sp. Alg231-50 TaxID=1922226 RepID=UPI00307CAC3F
MDKSGARSVGKVDAASETGALQLLRDRHLMPVKLQPDTDAKDFNSDLGMSGRKGGGLGRRAQINLTRQLSILLEAGMALPRALAVVGEQGNARVRPALTAVKEAVVSGKPLSSALDAPGIGLGPDLLSVIAAGEGVGTLSGSLGRVSDILEARAKLKDELLSSLLYPVILMILAVVSVLIVVMYLVPSLAPVFEGAQGEMPLMMTLVLGARASLEAHGVLYVAAGVVLFTGLVMSATTDAGKSLAIRVLLKVPMIGSTLRGLEAVRFTTTLSALLSGDVAILDAIRRSGQSCLLATSRQSAERAGSEVATGTRLSSALRQLDFIRPGSLELIAIGEDSNRLSEMLNYVAATTDLETRVRTERLIALFPPVLTILIGVFVGGIILSVMQAITSLNQLVQ